MPLPRLDILLYAHDGRGLGHISRTVAVAMALRRLQPELRLLIVSGSAVTSELLAGNPVDWLKLPSYNTVVSKGKSRGITGDSGYSDRELAELRRMTLEDIILRYRPRTVLVDHQPQGKHGELVAAQEASKTMGTRWILGIRGIVGSVPQSGSPLACRIFDDHFSDLLWYGDSRVLGDEHLHLLQEQYGRRARECGYVSRLQEIAAFRDIQALRPREKTAGTIAIPWQGEHCTRVLTAITQALELIGPNRGKWTVFCDPGTADGGQALEKLHRMAHCSIQPPGPAYVPALLNSGTGVVYGGYNSLTDILAIGLPAVVLLREMQDQEQQIHLRLLTAVTQKQFIPLAEETLTGPVLARALEQQLNQPRSRETVNLQGAENAARYLLQTVESGS